MHKSIMQHGKAECRFFRCLVEFGGGMWREILCRYVCVLLSFLFFEYLGMVFAITL